MVMCYIKLLVAILICGHLIKAEHVDKYYKLDSFGTVFIETEQKYNWFEAFNECAARNMSLIAVDTAEKGALLEKLLRKTFVKCPNLWIGGNDLGEEGKFVWMSTGKRFEYSNWVKGQPDNYNKNEHCAHYYTLLDFEWNDFPCSVESGFICEENRFLYQARHDWEIKKHFIDQLFAL